MKTIVAILTRTVGGVVLADRVQEIGERIPYFLGSSGLEAVWRPGVSSGTHGGQRSEDARSFGRIILWQNDSRESCPIDKCGPDRGGGQFFAHNAGEYHPANYNHSANASSDRLPGTRCVFRDSSATHGYPDGRAKPGHDPMLTAVIDWLEVNGAIEPGSETGSSSLI